MILGLEIFFLIFGLVALFTGKVKLGKQPIYGLGARLAGLIMVLALPTVAVALVIAIATSDDIEGPPKGILVAIEAGIILGMGLLAYIVARKFGTTVDPKVAVLDEDYDFEEERTPRTRGRSPAREEFGDDLDQRARDDRPGNRFDRTDGSGDEPRPRRRRPSDDE